MRALPFICFQIESGELGSSCQQANRLATSSDGIQSVTLTPTAPNRSPLPFVLKINARLQVHQVDERSGRVSFDVDPDATGLVLREAALAASYGLQPKDLKVCKAVCSDLQAWLKHAGFRHFGIESVGRPPASGKWFRAGRTVETAVWSSALGPEAA